MADPGDNPAMPPIEVGSGVPPFCGRKNNESSVNFLKVKVFGTPISMLAMGFGPLSCGSDKRYT